MVRGSRDVPALPLTLQQGHEPMENLNIKRLTSITDAQLRQLARVLIDCVDGGASVSLMNPISFAKTLAFWQGVAADVTMGARVLLLAEAERLYLRQGWVSFGVVLGFALLPQGGLCSTHFFYRQLTNKPTNKPTSKP